MDLNLLQVFRAVEETRHVTRAAKALGLSQSALSHALNRLRRELDDPLFVRTPRGMVPTPRAEALAEPVRQLLARVEVEVLGTGPFDPARLETTFRIRTTDFVEGLLLPPLLASLDREAPRARVVVTATTFSLPREALESGACDVAIGGFFGALPEGFYRQTLFTDSFRSAVRARHPRWGRKRTVSLDDFCEERHLLIAPGGDLRGHVDRELARRKRQRTVVGGLSSYLVSGWLLQETDHVLTAPSRLLGLLETRFPLRTFAPPVEIPPITIVQAWHERRDRDPGHRWLRAKIRSALKNEKE